MKFIKIYTKSQLVLLRNLNHFLGRYQLPYEILKKIDCVMEEGGMGKQGSIYILLEPVRDDIREIEDTINLYPLKVDLSNDLKRIDIRNINHPLAKGREWYFNYAHVHKTDCQIGVIYSILKKHLYKPL